MKRTHDTLTVADTKWPSCYIVPLYSVCLRDHIRNEEIVEAATVQPITTHLRMQKRLRLYWHARPRGSPTYMDNITIDITQNGMTASTGESSATQWCGRAFKVRSWESTAYIRPRTRLQLYTFVPPVTHTMLANMRGVINAKLNYVFWTSYCHHAHSRARLQVVIISRCDLQAERARYRIGRTPARTKL